jgi:hypothetical protein
MLLTFIFGVAIIRAITKELHRIKAMTGKRYGKVGFREPVEGVNRQRQPYA